MGPPAWTPHLVFPRDEVVDDEHLEPKLAAELTDVLQKPLDLALVLLLQICHLRDGHEEREPMGPLYGLALPASGLTQRDLLQSRMANAHLTTQGNWVFSLALLTSDLAAISMVQTLFSFLVFPCASSCKLVYFSSMSRRSCCLFF